MPHSTARLVVSLLISVVAFAGVAQSATFALQIDEPWNPTSGGTNTGVVDTVPVSAVAGRWNPAFNDETGYASALYGALAAEPGTVGDGFRVTLGQGQTDTLTITLGGTLTDPVFLIGDLDLVGSTVTVTPGFSSVSNNADSSWAGNVLTTLSGSLSDPETPGAFGGVQYTGDFASGSEFSFAFDYSDSEPGGGDFILVGLYVVKEGGSVPEPGPMPGVPEPGTALLLGLGFVALAHRRERR